MNKMMARLWIIAGCLMLAYGLWQGFGIAGRRWDDGIVFYTFALLFFGGAFYQNFEFQKLQNKTQRSEDIAQITYNLKDCRRLLFSSLCVLFFSAIVFIVGWIQDSQSYIAFSLVLAVMGIGGVLRAFPRIIDKQFMVFYPDGFTLRGVGFVPWNDVEVITVGSPLVVFIFRLGEEKSVSLPFWSKAFGAFRRKGERVFLRVSLHMADKDLFEFYMICRSQYARYCSGGRVGFDASFEEIDQIIENQTRPVVFVTDLKKAAKMF